ncbi:F-box protein At5g03100-like [Lycium ferocissimum]|uniref:F-box protein At5g03100-like n=1 Tax=Lycium ferocissimum TaxID=112874 RepID=UPI00281558A6|nr:F-box protein At5g03100-like [Lycium ferocissimum]
MSESSQDQQSVDYSPLSPRYSPSPVSPYWISDQSNEQEYYYGSKRRRKTENPDRISALPDSLILQILSFLRMKEVIRTGILSKRWHLLWTSAHTLIFRYSGQSNHGVTQFVTFIDDTLLQCQPSKLNKFSVDFYYNTRFVRHVNKWMIFVKNKSVEVLDLYLRTRGLDQLYSLPQVMYSNACLRELSLCNCNLVPKEGINWPLLRVLDIRYAKLKRDVVRKICSGCPVLESLKFSMCRGVGDFDIDSKSVKKLVISGYWEKEREDSDDDDDDDDDAELVIYAWNITSLEIRGCFHKKILTLRNVQSLVDAKLDFYRKTDDYVGDESDYDTDGNMLKDLLVSLQHVEKLSIGTWCLQVLTLLELRNSSCPRMRCKYLTLNTHMTKWELPGISILLQSCPQVEILNIITDPYFPEYHFGLSFKHSNNFSGENYWISRPCWVLHLKTLSIEGIWIDENYYFEHIFSFLQVVLKNAMVLEKIIIDGFEEGTYTSLMHYRRVTEKLLSFPRSSRDAVILFSG